MSRIPFSSGLVAVEKVTPHLGDLLKELQKAPHQVDYNLVLVTAVKLYAAAAGRELRPIAQPYGAVEAAARALLQGQTSLRELQAVPVDPARTEARCAEIGTARAVVGALLGLGEPLREALGAAAGGLRSDVKAHFDLVRPLVAAVPSVATALKRTGDFLYEPARRGARTRMAISKARAKERAKTRPPTNGAIVALPTPLLSRRRLRPR